MIGDLDAKRGESLLEEIGKSVKTCAMEKPPPADSRLSVGHFQVTDVTNWDSLRALFLSAWAKYGKIDVVLANAGVPERPPFLFEDATDQDGFLKEPDFRLIDVNLNGVLRSMCLLSDIVCGKLS